MRKGIVLLFTLLFFSVAVNAQIRVEPTGCVEQICVPAEYKSITETIITPAVTYQKPLMETVTKQVCVKEAAIEEYTECVVGDPKRIKVCSREIPAEFRTITYQIPTGLYETVTVQPKQETTVIIEVKLNDGYIATVPCGSVTQTK